MAQENAKQVGATLKDFMSCHLNIPLDTQFVLVLTLNNQDHILCALPKQVLSVLAVNKIKQKPVKCGASHDVNIN